MDEQQTSGGIPTQKDLRQVHDSMVEGLGQLADYFGFSKVMGQLYATLWLSGSPLSLDELMEHLGISKASVSMNMRSLEMLGMVRQVWVRGGGSRRKYYEAETDFWQIISNVVGGREMRDVERAIHVMQENSEQLLRAMPEMNEQEQEIARGYVERMGRLQALFRFAQLVITTIIAQAGSMDFSDVTEINLS